MTIMTEAGDRDGRGAGKDRRDSCSGASGAFLWWAIRLLVLAALGLSTYLMWSSFTSTGVAGCGEGEQGCASVLNSRWRSWLGVPVSALAVILYLAMLPAAFLGGTGADPRRRRWAWTILLPASVLAGGAALWFIGLQVLVIKAFCPYCMAAHGCALALAAAVVLLSRSDGVGLDMIRPAARNRLLLAGLVGLVLLIGGQVAFPAATSRVETVAETDVYDTGPGPDRVIRLVGGQVTISPHALPITGSPDSAGVAVAFFAYDCPICRAEYQHLKLAAARYGPRLAVVWLPLGCRPSEDALPAGHQHDEKCDHSEIHPERCQYAMLAAAVWRHAPEHFPRFHDWLMTDAPPMMRGNSMHNGPAVEHSRAYAASLIGEENLQRALDDPELSKAVLQWRDWRRALPDRGTEVPVVSVGNHVIYGELYTARELFDSLEKSLHITPLAPPDATPAPTDTPRAGQ